ncbi:hypothetical protein [Ktedonobacter racemifer]|uniref:Uncharacterized protein n=1 Tax=Ktedonobacter racemifer DSM 44963 TaxID=485913 RepID=D6TXI1_KTERA|nr:hypothetical protein [Ktedonobacter racemifer]EFH84914.1 conserved hypothetical protein [Ktedonobacter racemifer DSM 44963]
MSSSTLYRLSGIGLLVGGLLATLGTIIQGFSNDNLLSPLWIPAGLAVLIGEMFFLLSLPGLYTRQAHNAGVIGLVGFILFFLSALLLGIGTSTLYIFIFPWLTQNAPRLADGPSALNIFFPVAGLLNLIGALLFGIATLRAGILSRAAAILLLVAAVVSFAANFVPLPYMSSITTALTFIALAWLGSSLLTERSQEATTLSPVSPPNSIRV